MILTTNSFGQTIQELEHNLLVHKSSEKYGDKIETAKQLQYLDPFNYRATEYICRYYHDRKIDFISNYFDNLIAKFPNHTEPYLLRAELLFLELDYRVKDEYNRKKVKYLKQGLDIDPKDALILFKLAEVYYIDFISPLKREKNGEFSFDFGYESIDTTLVVKEKPIKKSTFEHAADSSLKYFYQVWNLKKDKIDVIYYPIRQLECFLKQTDKTPITKETESTFSQCYFPSFYFANLTDNWECDFLTDYLFEIESGKGTAEWLKIQLDDLQENCLYNNLTQNNSTIYRFTWLRSFHHPIAIRIEKAENEIMLSWKIGKGAGGYEPKGLKKSGEKRLSLKKWKAFEKLIKESNFDNLPNKKYTPMNDGATWTLEKKSFDSFKAHHSNCPTKEIKAACLYLLKLTKVQVKEEDKY